MVNCRHITNDDIHKYKEETQMKKILSLFLTLLLTASLAACGNQTEGTSGTSVEPSASETQPAASDTGNETEPADMSEDTMNSYTFNQNATIEETILVDEYDVKITATELTYDDYSAELALVIENNSDRNLSFIANSIGYSCNSVNGYMLPDGYLNCDVAAGKKATDTISIAYDSLMAYGISEIADLEIGFDISDDDYNHTYTGPCAILTSAADSYDYSRTYYRNTIASEASQTGNDYSVSYFSTDAVYEENGLAIVSQTMINNKGGESILLLEIENTTGETVNVSTADIDLNGLRIYDSTWSSDTINPGKTAIVNIDLSSVLEPEYWTIYGITDADNVALKIFFTNEDDEEVSEPAYLSIDISGTEATFSMEGTEIYNDNGLRLISKGIYADSSRYSDNLHLLLIAENTSGQTLALHNVYDSLSLNDYMASYSYYTTTIENDVCVMIDILLWGDDLEDIGISGPSDIQSVELSLTIRDEDYTEIDEANIAFTIE